MAEQITLPKEKSRWTESEWWLTIGTIGVGLLVKLGIISPEQEGAGLDIVNNIESLVMMLAPVLGWQYFRSKRKVANRRDERKLIEAEVLAKRPLIYEGKVVRSRSSERPEPPKME